MRMMGVARGKVASRARKRRSVLAIGGVVGAICLACGADAGDGSEPESSTLSLDTQADAKAPHAPAATTAARNETPDPEAPAPAESSAPLAAPSRPPIETPPSGQPAPLPSAELETPRSLDRLAPAEVVIEGDCRFEFLGESVHCDRSDSTNVQETDATDLVTCMRQCLERDDCSAVTDYLWLGRPGLGCFLYLSRCDEPALETLWGAADGGRDFRRRCD